MLGGGGARKSLLIEALYQTFCDIITVLLAVILMILKSLYVRQQEKQPSIL
jgi:hypothetical protein